MSKAARKTIDVGTLLARANQILASQNTTQQEREMMCGFIEGVLHETGNYRGFRYLDSEDYPEEVVYASSRRCYYVSTEVEDDYRKAEGV